MPPSRGDDEMPSLSLGAYFHILMNFRPLQILVRSEAFPQELTLSRAKYRNQYLLDCLVAGDLIHRGLQPSPANRRLRGGAY